MSKNKSRKRSALARGTRSGQVHVIEMADLKRPEILGFADRFYLTESGDHIELSFFEARPAGRLVPIFRAYIPIDDLVFAIWPTIPQFLAETKEFFADSDSGENLRVAAVPASAVDVLPNASNLIRMARAGLDGQVDFYCLTPQSVHLAKTEGKKLTVLPVASLIVPGRLLLSLMSVFEGLVPGLRERLPAIAKKFLGADHVE